MIFHFLDKKIENNKNNSECKGLNSFTKINHDIFTISTFNFVTKFDYLLYHNNQTLNNSENSLTSPQATIRVEESPKELKVTREIGISVTLKMVSTEVPFAKVSEEILAKLCICIDTGMIRVSVIAMASRRHASELFLLQTSEPRPKEATFHRRH